MKLAAAVRSGSVTTAMTYDERAGTSICESIARTSRSPKATPSQGAKAAAIKQRLATPARLLGGSSCF